MSAKTEEYTLGVEEEYQVIDPETRGLSPGGEGVLRRARQTLGEEQVAPELRTSQIEAMTPVCRTLSEVRRALAAAARGHRNGGGGKLPDRRREHAPVLALARAADTPKERYRKIVEREQQLAREQVVFGFHVHIGIEDREAAVQVMNRARVWLAPLLALSANSPFWLGEDTGYASYRTQIWGSLPTAGPPGHFNSLAEHDALVKALVATGGAMEASQVYWDIRLPEKLETVEIRVADVCSRMNEAVMLAGLSHALMRTCHERAERGEPYPLARPELLRAAHWVASRHGLDAELVDVEAGRAVPAREMIENLLAFARPALEEHGDWDEVSALARKTLEQGNGARRQRRAYERTGRLEDVVDMLIAETAQGTDST